MLGVSFLGQTELGGDHLGQGIVAQVIEVQAVEEQVGAEYRRAAEHAVHVVARHRVSLVLDATKERHVQLAVEGAVQ
ncbi:hypothetical protein D3C78_1954590 [compost metagenome]